MPWRPPSHKSKAGTPAKPAHLLDESAMTFGDDEDDIDPRDVYVDPEQLSAMEQDGDRIQYHTKQAAHRTMRMAAEAQEIGHNTIS